MQKWLNTRVYKTSLLFFLLTIGTVRSEVPSIEEIFRKSAPLAGMAQKCGIPSVYTKIAILQYALAKQYREIDETAAITLHSEIMAYDTVRGDYFDSTPFAYCTAQKKKELLSENLRFLRAIQADAEAAELEFVMRQLK